jgi:hypothetical protein
MVNVRPIFKFHKLPTRIFVGHHAVGFRRCIYINFTRLYQESRLSLYSINNKSLNWALNRISKGIYLLSTVKL